MADKGVSRKILVVERRWCPHCSQNLSLKTYKAHKRMYYDLAIRQWLTKSTLTVKVQEDDSNDSSDNEYFSESPPQSEDDGTMTLLSIECSLSKHIQLDSL